MKSDFAWNFRGRHESLHSIIGYYTETWTDDLIYGSYWVAKAAQTFEPENYETLLAKANSWPTEHLEDESFGTLYWSGNGFGWGQKHPGMNLLAYQLTGSQDSRARLDEFINTVKTGSAVTPGGWVFQFS